MIFFFQLNVTALTIYVVSLVATHYLLVAQSIHGKVRSLPMALQEQITPDWMFVKTLFKREMRFWLFCTVITVYVGHFCKGKIWSDTETFINNNTFFGSKLNL